MAPKEKSPMDLLFHPKKKKLGQGPIPPRKPPQQQGPPGVTRPKPPPKSTPDPDINPPPPTGEFAEFKLMSSALNGWKYDLMKLDSRKTVDVATWPMPVKLNRKEPKREVATTVATPQAVGPMLGADGKPVIGADGRQVMVDAEGKPIHNSNGFANGNGASTSSSKDDKSKSKSRKFKKKTNQVYLIPEKTRQIRKEERYPWVLEDATGQDVWVGKMEEASKSDTHAFFMPTAGDVFKFVPANRWYKFQKKPNYQIPTLEEAESMMAKIQKNKDPERWLIRNGKKPSTSTSAMFQAASSPSHTGLSLPGASLGPGGRRLRTVDTGLERRLFGDDDDDDGAGNSRKKREREYGGEGDVDELDYEEDFADDEEKLDVNEAEDEEAKELEDRIKREYRRAKGMKGNDESEDEDEDAAELTSAGKQMKKLIRNLEKNAVYDSDEEENPYASEQEEEEEEEPPEVLPVGPAVQDQSRSQSRAASKSPAPAPAASIKVEPIPSRPTSPVSSGHSIVAKRATSPKAPKVRNGGKSPAPSRATSPLAQAPGGGSATSPAGSRAGSPVVQTQLTTNGAPVAGSKPSNKRKAIDEATASSPTSPNPNGGPPKPKKRKPLPPAAAAGPPPGELDANMLIEWLRVTPGATTRDCIHHFTAYLTDDTKKTRFTGLVKEVAKLNEGRLSLKPQFRVGGAAGQDQV